MSLSRRKFTQEFKLSAVERLQQGASAAEVSRVFETNPNLLHRWRITPTAGCSMPPTITSIYCSSTKSPSA